MAPLVFRGLPGNQALLFSPAPNEVLPIKLKNNAEFLKSLVEQGRVACLSSDNLEFLLGVLNSRDPQENPRNPESFHTEFALNRAKSRLERTVKMNKPTYGIPELIPNLEKLGNNSAVQFYNLSTSDLTGTCFVFNEVLQGFEFVEKGGSVMKAGADFDLLTRYT